jgi:flagellar biosynthesis protein FlhG
MTTVVAVAGGKAKDGQSVLGANLSQYLNHKGHPTALVVAGARKPVWGVEPRNHWPDVLNGRLPLDNIIHRDVFGIDLIVTENCGRTLQEFCPKDASGLDGTWDILDTYTYLIIDLTAVISAATLACCLAATATILMMTPDPPTLTGAYEWLSLMARHDFQQRAVIVLDQVDNPVLAQSVYLRIRDLAQKRLKLQTNFWGSLSKEPKIDSRAGRRFPLSQTMPQSELLRNIHAVGERLVAEHPPQNPAGPFRDFWRCFLEHLEKMPDDRLPLDLKQPSAFTDIPPMEDSRHPAMATSQTLTILNARLASISRDLKAIRQLMEIGFGQSAANNLQKKAAPSQRASLDFDIFISQHQNREEP